MTFSRRLHAPGAELVEQKVHFSLLFCLFSFFIRGARHRAVQAGQGWGEESLGFQSWEGGKCQVKKGGVKGRIGKGSPRREQQQQRQTAH